MHYRVRAVSFALAFVATSMQIYGKGYSLSAWIFLGLLFLVYPHFQYWRASTAQKPVQAERINLLIDSVLLGLFAAALQFSIWLSFAAILANLINSVANKGWRGVPQSIVALLAGALLWISVNGFKLSLHSAWPTTMVCIVGLAGYVLVMVHVGFKRNLQLRDIKTRQRVILEGVQSGVIAMSERGIVESFNQSAEQMFGYGAAEVVGNNVSMLMPEPCQGKHDGDLDNNLHSDVKKAIGRRCEMLGRRKDGSRFHMALGVYETLLNDRRLFIATASDISAHKQAQDRIELLAFSDPLTGLPNRRLLMDRLHQALAASARLGLCGAVLLIDLDDFKTLNDTLGHDKGDLLLQQVAQRLTTCVRAGDTVARLGGDEFVVMLEGLAEYPKDAASQAEAVGEKILAALNQPYLLAGVENRSTPSIGITLFNGLQNSIEELLKWADLAMYQSKAVGRNTLHFFDPAMQAMVTARAALEVELREAVSQQRFILHYQPQVDGDGRPTGVEALIRWQHPQRGMVSPAEFISLAEDTGLILSLGNWVLETACTQLARWAEQPQMAHLTMAVNVSARQFRNKDFVGQVMAALDHSGADPHRLKMELTESLLLDGVEETIEKMNTLKALGMSFSLDDFGTGYSSLAYLKRLPLSQMKIDQSFVRDILTDPHDAAICRTVIALAQSLGLAVIAEGVESEAQRDFLAGQGCRAYQGYLFGRPLPADGCEAYVRRG
ncbi:MAG: EAL domain-containing protein [Rhodoferax sp.]|uniref:putative bifunctional diguanylate cyclase/phosphodiesterase n=1 Tax=Rhodoferax sp. TaxID=50421 RepID=UPI003C78C7AC